MCRNIKPLFHLDPPVTEDEVRAAAVQFVRKVSGFQRPSRANAEAFERAIDEIARATDELLGQLETSAPPRSREALAARARERGAKRYAQAAQG